MPTRAPAGYVAAAATDWVSKGHLDKYNMPPETGCPVGWYIGPPNVYSTGVATATTGVWCLNPVFIGFGGGTFDAFVSNMTTARVAGTATATIFALFADDGTGYPDTSVVLASATVVVTTTGKVISTFSGGAVALGTGVYWIGSLYYAGTVAPTTAEQFSCISGQTMNTPLSPTITVGSSMRGLRSNAATFTGLPGTKIAAANMITQTAATSHYVMLRRSA